MKPFYLEKKQSEEILPGLFNISEYLSFYKFRHFNTTISSCNFQ